MLQDLDSNPPNRISLLTTSQAEHSQVHFRRPRYSHKLGAQPLMMPGNCCLSMVRKPSLCLGACCLYLSTKPL